MTDSETVMGRDDGQWDSNGPRPQTHLLQLFLFNALKIGCKIILFKVCMRQKRTFLFEPTPLAVTRSRHIATVSHTTLSICIRIAVSIPSQRHQSTPVEEGIVCNRLWQRNFYRGGRICFSECRSVNYLCSTFHLFSYYHSWKETYNRLMWSSRSVFVGAPSTTLHTLEQFSWKWSIIPLEVTLNSSILISINGKQQD